MFTLPIRTCFIRTINAIHLFFRQSLWRLQMPGWAVSAGSHQNYILFGAVSRFLCLFTDWWYGQIQNFDGGRSYPNLVGCTHSSFQWIDMDRCFWHVSLHNWPNCSFQLDIHFHHWDGVRKTQADLQSRHSFNFQRRSPHQRSLVLSTTQLQNSSFDIFCSTCRSPRHYFCKAIQGYSHQSHYQKYTSEGLWGFAVYCPFQRDLRTWLHSWGDPTNPRKIQTII